MKGKTGKRCADIDNRVPYIAGWAEDAVDRKRLVRLICPAGHVEGVSGKAPARAGAHWGMICDTFGVTPEAALTWCDFHEVERPAAPPASWSWRPPTPPPPKPKPASKAPPRHPNFKPAPPAPILFYHPVIAAALEDGTIDRIHTLAHEVQEYGMRELPAIAQRMGLAQGVVSAAVGELKLRNSAARAALLTGATWQMLVYLKAHPQTRASGLADADVIDRDVAHKMLRLLAARVNTPAVAALKNSPKNP